MAVTKAQASAHYGGVVVNDIKVVGEQVANVPSLDITWSSNEPTAASTQTIANGSVPTVAELGQAVANLTAKLNLIIAGLEAHGLLASS